MTIDFKQSLSIQTVQRGAWVLLLLAISLKFVSIFAAVIHPDSNYYLNIASNYMMRGGLTPYMWRIDQDANIVAGSGTGYGVLLMVYWLRVFGLTVVAGNMLSYLAGLGSLLAIYLVARKLWDPLVALMTITYMAINTVFLQNATLRMDALAILAYSLLLLLHVTALHRKRLYLHFILGVLVIVSIEIHTLGVLYVGAFTLYYGIEHLKVLIAERRLWKFTPALYYGVGLMLAAAAYVVIRILPDPYAYFLIPNTCDICVSPGLISEGLRYLALTAYSPIEASLLILAIISAIVRRGPSDRYALAVIAGCLLAMAVFSPPPGFTQYFGHTTPAIALGVGVFLSRGFTRQPEIKPAPFELITQADAHPQFQMRRLVTAALAGCFVLAFNAATMQTWHWNNTNYTTDPRIAYIRKYIPTDVVVVSRPSFYFMLIDYDNYLSYHDGELFGIELRDENYNAFWEREHPQVVINNQPSVLEEEALWAYMQRHQFEEVMPGLWIDPALKPSA